MLPTVPNFTRREIWMSVATPTKTPSSVPAARFTVGTPSEETHRSNACLKFRPFVAGRRGTLAGTGRASSAASPRGRRSRTHSSFSAPEQRVASAARRLRTSVPTQTPA